MVEVEKLLGQLEDLSMESNAIFSLFQFFF